MKDLRNNLLEMGAPFNSDFWIKALNLLGYKIKIEEFDISILKRDKIIPSNTDPKKAIRLYNSEEVEIALIEFEDSSNLNRNLCTKIARSWKEKRLIRPLLIFTNGYESYAVIVPGKGIGGEAKVLWLSEKLYRTDVEVLNSISYPGNDKDLKNNYDTIFFPYEKVRDEFFEDYRNLYQNTEKAVREYLGDKSNSYAQRFLGRLMFLYFLQRKGWLNKDKNYINKIKDYKELNRLFYESLNKGETPGIPFLNGSLFEKEEYLDENMENLLYPKMNEIFLKARETFNKYNFTVDELSPLEIDVSIDPALLGTVFENMLPEYERGSKGTFYTPKEEISFICRRALANYLGYKDEIYKDVKDGKWKFKDGLEIYIEKLRELKSEKEVRQLKEKLLSIRILDPAVGSGGFLLVMMQEMIKLIQEAEATVGWFSDVKELKEKILPHLYGFDIEPEAVEIARLRLWLSLIIDQKEPEPLPNLDFNLLAIKDSLYLPENLRYIDEDLEKLRTRLEMVKDKYVNEHDWKSKKMLKDEIQEITGEINKKTGRNEDVIEAFMSYHPDIIVMNPPYVRQESIPKDLKEYYVDKYKLDKKSDLYAYFLLRALSLLSEKGIASVICSDKWLESEYGIKLQEKLKDKLIAIYSQKNRSFGADVNTIIVVYGKEDREDPINFTYVESYTNKEIRQNIKIERE